jgi:hypothetical protein
MNNWGLEKGAREMKNVQKVRSLVALAFVTALVLVPAAAALADGGTVVAQEPYEAPEIQEIETPSWLRFFEPLAALPLWGQAAVLSAGVAGMFFVVPMVFRWVWSLGPDNESEDEGGEQP